MNKKFWYLFKKELLTIIRDKKSFTSFIILSLLLNPLLIGGLSLLQDAQKNQIEKDQTIIAIKNETNNINIVDAITNDKKINPDVTIINSNNYQDDLEKQKIKGYIDLTQIGDIIKATYVFDQTSNLSQGSGGKIQSIINKYLANINSTLLASKGLTTNSLESIKFDQISLQQLENKPAQNGVLLLLLPYFILVGLIQGASQFAIELTSGEKERNTLATTLSLNASRVTIGLAKVFTILLISLLSLTLNVGSLIITTRLFPNYFGASSGSGVSIDMATVGQIFLIMLPLSFLISSLLILLGTYARNAKEGSLYLLPLLLGSVFIGFSGQVFDANSPIFVFIIPLVGQIALIKQVLTGTFILQNYLISALSTIVLFFVILTVTIKMFSREEVIFRQ